MLSVMDAFSGHHQIHLRQKDQEKASFITDRGLYYYKVMLFGLKNVGETYQRLVNKVGEPFIRTNMEVYVDDMILKSVQDEGHPVDLQGIFQVLRQYDMKLNPKGLEILGVHDE